MEREEYEIRDFRNRTKLIATTVGFNEYDAMANARLVGKYRIKEVSKSPGKPWVIRVNKI